MCVRFYGDYNKAGIQFDLPTLMKAFWSDGAVYFLVYVHPSHFSNYSGLLTCEFRNFGKLYNYHSDE